VQNSYGGDDATEWFGGTVNGKYFVNFRTVDDIFDTDFGYSGKNQFMLGISDPNIADVSGSNGFESDNDAQGSTNGPKTNAHFSNVTLLGPLDFSSTVNSNFKRAAHIRRCSYLDIFNSTLTGFPIGLLLDGDCTNAGFISGEVEFEANTLVNAAGKNVTTTIAASLPAIFNAFTTNGNDSLASFSNLMLTDPAGFAGNNPDFRPMTGSPLWSGADFTSPTVMDPFFTATNFRGAFGDTDWTDCWTEWDPINADYTHNVDYSLTPGFTYLANDHEVVFTGTTAGAVSYAWDFGDGSQGSTAENPTYTFAGGVGNIDVTLTVTSSRGCVAEITQTVGLTATHEVTGLTALKVFPNPTSNVANVDFMLKNQMEITVELRDLNGRLVRTANQEFRAGFNRHELNTSGLNSGVYFLRLVSAEGEQTVRVSVIK
ncbi:MAG: T9SS type A sorting domain-containing protein, partial [Bacteroidetes bacterium]|nr:T9SS type A sorting domain-containing protein [Bacteroidota bacterium]